jgi:hypothetical protein
MSSEPLSARGVTLAGELFLAGIRAQTHCTFKNHVYTVAEQRRDFTDLPRFKLGLLDSSTRTGMRLHPSAGRVKWFEVVKRRFPIDRLALRIARLTAFEAGRNLTE